MTVSASPTIETTSGPMSQSFCIGLKLYDRTQDEISLDEVERIRI
jgi:hypothetical protein